MDRSLEALENGSLSSGRRAAAAFAVATAVMAGASLLIWTCPTEGYRAGFRAVVDKGPQWIAVEVDAADGTVLRLCETLSLEEVTDPGIDYGDFVDGCSAGVDHLFGRHVPVLAAG